MIQNLTNVDGERKTGRGNVMVVDDQPANLRLMEEMLVREGYSVRSFPRGRLALNAVGQCRPDLILLDITMPEMDGFEVCARLKADAALRGIPVIFLSALNEPEDKIKAFKAGGVDYITKPFNYAEVQARVENHLELQEARKRERELLEETLNGAVRTMAELVHLSGPFLASRSTSIRNLVAHMCSGLEVDQTWQYELAAILCLTGCIALPPDAFERAYGRTGKPSDEEMFRAHPQHGASLLARIPRLENVAEMILHQQDASQSDLPLSTIADRGARMLQVAVEIDRWIFKGLPFKMALAQLRSKPHYYPSEFVNALEDYSPPTLAFEVKWLQLRELRAAMVAEDDVVTKDGNSLILPKGTVFTTTVLERIRNFDRTRGISQPFHVQVPLNASN